MIVDGSQCRSTIPGSLSDHSGTLVASRQAPHACRGSHAGSRVARDADSLGTRCGTEDSLGVSGRSVDLSADSNGARRAIMADNSGDRGGSVVQGCVHPIAGSELFLRSNKETDGVCAPNFDVCKRTRRAEANSTIFADAEFQAKRIQVSESWCRGSSNAFARRPIFHSARAQSESCRLSVLSRAARQGDNGSTEDEQCQGRFSHLTMHGNPLSKQDLNEDREDGRRFAFNTRGRSANRQAAEKVDATLQRSGPD